MRIRVLGYLSISTVAIIAVSALTVKGMSHQPNPHDDPETNAFLTETVAPGVTSPVMIHFDHLQIPTIRGESANDVGFAQGYIHARDRFFQMDGMRRMAAGELAEAFGPMLLPMDQDYRAFRFRHVARQVVENLDDETRQLFERYAAGVNHALKTWEEPPFEYGMLNLTPEAWKPEDSVLVMLVMFDMLHMEGQLERQIGVMRDVLPNEVVDFLTPTRSRFDALLIGGEIGSNDWEPMPIPGPEVIDLRDRAAVMNVEELVNVEPLALGSNNWAVAGSRTRDGRAIVANDPHLLHQVPPIWYRVELYWPDHELTGLSLPGMPGIVIGSNGHIAWGFTNSMYDFQDLIVIEVDPDDPSRYRTPDGYEPFGEIVEEISIRGRPVDRMTLKTTRWGVVTDHDHRGRPLVMKWTALEAEMVNVNVFDIARARTIEEGVEAFRNWQGPSQNVLLACREGRIAWVVSGTIPKRIGFDGMYPVSWADGDIGWDGAITEDDRPVLIDPPNGFLFTANNRTVSAKHSAMLGGIWTAGARARRIFELLENAKGVDEKDLFAMQLDTRVAILDFYAELAHEANELYAALNDDENQAEDRRRIAQSRVLLEQWDGTAEGDQSAVRLLNWFRRVLHQRVIGQLVAPCREVDPTFSYRWFMEEEPVQRILEERPAHLLPRGNGDWESFITDAWTAALRVMERSGGEAGLAQPWGEANRLAVQHPLAMVIPGLGRRLSLPDDPQPGHSHALRVATPRFGASARLVVSPGREEDGILHLPGGQSGDPRSPHFLGTYNDWLEGRPSPYQASDAARRIRLTPAQGDSE